MTTKSFQTPADEEIARYAYYLWESEGRIPGRDLDYWLQAKSHLTADREHEARLLATDSVQEIPRKKFENITASSPAATKPARRRPARSARDAVFA